MPNWCQNQLTVTDATPELRDWLRMHRFSFQQMNPPRKPRNPPGTSWQSRDPCYNAWGTKWDLDEDEQRKVADDLLEDGFAFFDTAWSPPLQAIEALSQKFPDAALQLTYCELGMFFAGVATFQGGECEDDSYEDEPQVMKIASEVFGYEDEETCGAEATA